MRKYWIAFLLIFFSTCGLARAQASLAAQATLSPTTQPAMATTQPVVIVNADTQDQTLGEVFRHTRVGQLFEGKEKVTLDEVRNPLFWVDTIKDLVLATLAFIPRVIVAILFLFFFWLVYRGVRRLVIGSMNKAAVDPSIRDMLGHLIKWSIMGFGLVIACNQVGIQIAALLTGVGIIGIAVGFAAQETLSNFIAGIVIFWDKPFRVGDWLEIGDTYGKVQRVTFRSTRLLDLNGQVIIYPNTYMLANRVSNHTTHPLTRVAVSIGVAYKESIDAARAALLSTIQNDARISHEPHPQVIVSNCGDSSVNLQLRFWIRDESLEKSIVHEYTEKAKNALDAAKIEIPFPHVQLMMEESAGIEQLANGMRKAG